MEVNETAWQGENLTERYLNGVRGAIPLAETQMDIMLRLIRWVQEEVTAVLDLGCGDGILGQVVLDHYPKAKGVFADFSAPMLEAAQRRLADYKERVTLVQVDYGNRDWRLETCSEQDRRIGDWQFDVIVSGYSIHHQTDERKREIYAELYELLVPGGIFINVEHVSSRSKWGEMMFEEAFVDSLVAYHKQIGSSQTRAQISHDLYNRPDKAANKLTAVETQCDWLRDIGFIHVDCYLKYFELALFGGVKWQG
ncbi:MAG: class I SAM-dependent methyltransferase [Chloroflexi bacterium]|nr:class I SAM-dependent methyltransferase [Chloroflexota bacterium]